MRRTLVALFVGALFGVGLVVSGMTDPRNIVSFLDFSGRWNPNLAFVMVGAIGVHATALFVTRRRGVGPAQQPVTGGVDLPLVAGAAIFGVGWGLSGYCPGPAVVSLGSGALAPVVFVAATLAGVLLADVRFRTPATDGADPEAPIAKPVDARATAPTS